MKIIPDFITNTPDIISLLEEYNHLFVPRKGSMSHESIIPGLKSQFSTLIHEKMPDILIDTIFKKSKFSEDIRRYYAFIQIQKYEPGDFIVPHADNYEIMNLHLVILTTSDKDGFILEHEGKLHRILDQAGQKIEFDLNAVHWVDPVINKRYSLVIGE